jgi:hypothetical protein
MNGTSDEPGIIESNWSAYTVAPFISESRVTIGHTSDEGRRTVM